MRPLGHRERSTLTILIVGLLGAACVQPSSPGVSVAPLKADIVFGVKEAVEEVAAPPNFTPAPVFFQAEEPLLEDEEAFDEKVLEIPDIKPLPRTPIAQAAEECPAAALTAFPAETADVAVRGMPREGVYKFKRTISATAGGEAASRSGFEQRVIRNVKPTSKPYEFTYEVVQPDNFNPGRFTVTSFRVNNNPAVIQSVNQPPQTVGVVPVPGAEQIITPPQDEPGIFVDKISSLNADGIEVEPFNPLRPLKYLPLDEGILRAGQTFDTIGIDATTGTVIRHQGTVVRKTRVDACGDIVEGWLVEATQTASNDQTTGPVSERKYFYNIATQLGSLFIAENTTYTSGENTASVDLSIAELEPTPIPEGLK